MYLQFLCICNFSQYFTFAYFKSCLVIMKNVKLLYKMLFIYFFYLTRIMHCHCENQIILAHTSMIHTSNHTSIIHIADTCKMHHFFFLMHKYLTYLSVYLIWTKWSLSAATKYSTSYRTCYILDKLINLHLFGVLR